MPVYEYRCEACGEDFELFVRSPSRQVEPTCPKCGSREVQKAVSLVGVGRTGTSASAAACSSGPT
jgi:putative FmdB family regulatory protein